MDKLLAFLDGKKLYLTALATAVIAFLNALGVVIPDYVYQLLTAFGIWGAKSALTKVGTGK